MTNRHHSSVMSIQGNDRGPIPSNDDSRILLRVSRVAILLDMSRSRIYQLINEGSLPVVRIGGRSIRVRRDELKDWIDRQSR